MRGVTPLDGRGLAAVLDLEPSLVEKASAALAPWQRGPCGALCLSRAPRSRIFEVDLVCFFFCSLVDITKVPLGSAKLPWTRDLGKPCMRGNERNLCQKRVERNL